jgi:ribosomal protein S18 acetylase RimI-like enzyme
MARFWWRMRDQGFHDPLHEPKPEKEYLKAAEKVFENHLKDGKHFAFIALEDKEKIGFVCCRLDSYNPSPFKQSRLVYVEQIYVDEKHRRKGIATKLMQKSFNEARNKDASIVYLATEFWKKRNLAFYHSLGFKEYHYKMFKEV